MPPHSTATPEKPRNAFPTIIFAGLTAGFLDGVAASLHYFISTGNNPTKVFQYIASAVFGKSAFSGGLGMAGWGIVFHFIIAMAFAWLFYLIYSIFFRFLKNKLIIGIVFGLMVWVIMNLAVVPFTKAPPIPFQIQGAIINMLILIFMVGLPISLIIHWYFATKGKADRSF